MFSAIKKTWKQLEAKTRGNPKPSRERNSKPRRDSDSRPMREQPDTERKHPTPRATLQTVSADM